MHDDEQLRWQMREEQLERLLADGDERDNEVDVNLIIEVKHKCVF